MLKKAIRAKYTPEFKHGAVRMAEAKDSIAKTARSVDVAAADAVQLAQDRT